MTPKVKAIIGGVVWAVIIALLPPGASVACLLILVFFGRVAKAMARRSYNARYWVAAIYFGTILGMFLAFYLSTLHHGRRFF